jgi:hypothetical protein
MTELERALVALGAELEFPPTPDLAGAVRARLGRPRWRRPLVFAVAVAALAIGIAMAVPPARSAILRFFHIGSATIERVETLPPARQRPLVAGLGPPVAHPTLRVPPGVVAKRYYSRPGVNAALLRYRGRPVLLAEISGQQLDLAKKVVEKQTIVEPVDLGEAGLWLEGPQHVLIWHFNTLHVVPTRLAGNVLVWLRNGITYRLEGDLSKAEMLALARKITP